MASAATIGTLSDALGRNSYEVLAHALGVQDEPVLDLACGDGYLLELVRRDHDCLGVDWNAAELSAASRRLGSHAPLARADAADLPIATRSFGAVLCHYALMLLQPLEGVLAELARILRPGGLLAAVLPRASSDSGVPRCVEASERKLSFSIPPIEDGCSRRRVSASSSAKPGSPLWWCRRSQFRSRCRSMSSRSFSY
jgi:ubiquinone/menaquinone biosynthesis C-methylase UbiE